MKNLTMTEKIALAGLFVAVLAAIPAWLVLRKPEPVKCTYVGRVLNQENKKRIDGAKVTLDYQTESYTEYTNAEGISRFVIPCVGDNSLAKVSVDADGYESYSREIPLLPKIEPFYLKPTNHTDVNSSRQTPTTVTPNAPTNSSPSPKPIQQNRVVYQQKFEGDLVTTNDCDPKESALAEGGRTGRGLKVTNNNKIWGCRSFQLPKVYEAGKTYQASVWCKGDKEAKCQLFFGEPHKVDQEARDNESKAILQGNGDWQKITTNPIKIRPDKYVVVQVYSIEVPGKSVIFDDILVEEVIN